MEGYQMKPIFGYKQITCQDKDDKGNISREVYWNRRTFFGIPYAGRKSYYNKNAEFEKNLPTGFRNYTK